jgi:hypothetical protein
MNNEEVLDNVETMLAYLICGKSKKVSESLHLNDTKNIGGDFDVSEILNFEPMLPKNVYTYIDGDRLVSPTRELLLNNPQDLFGQSAEVAFLDEEENVLKWSGYRKLKKRPHNIWVSSPKADLYEWHYRCIYANGLESYYKRVVGFDKHGKPVKALVVGSKGGADKDGEFAVLAASLIEDVHRPKVIKATVKEDASIIFPVPLGEHKEIFSLREAPLTPSGRKKAILHWVKNHTRKITTSTTNVQQHWRGTREIQIDGFNIKLEESTNEARNK